MIWRQGDAELPVSKNTMNGFLILTVPLMINSPPFIPRKKHLVTPAFDTSASCSSAQSCKTSSSLSYVSNVIRALRFIINLHHALKYLDSRGTSCTLTGYSQSSSTQDPTSPLCRCFGTGYNPQRHPYLTLPYLPYLTAPHCTLGRYLTRPDTSP